MKRRQHQQDHSNGNGNANGVHSTSSSTGPNDQLADMKSSLPLSTSPNTVTDQTIPAALTPVFASLPDPPVFSLSSSHSCDRLERDISSLETLLSDSSVCNVSTLPIEDRLKLTEFREDWKKILNEKKKQLNSQRKEQMMLAWISLGVLLLFCVIWEFLGWDSPLTHLERAVNATMHAQQQQLYDDRGVNGGGNMAGYR